LIKSKTLSEFKNIKHGFFNSKGGFSKGIYKSLNCGPGSSDQKSIVKKNLELVLRKLNSERKKLVLLNQIHSNKVFYINKKNKKKLIGDGAITKNKSLAIGILTADCCPILFFDPIQNIIGAAHAGWRGAFKKIGKKMIRKFIKKGSKLKDLRVVIGPTISQKNYEVRKDFKSRFLDQNLSNNIFFRNKRKKLYFDLVGYISAQLKNNGIKNIEIIKKDTFNPKNNFFSARRSLKKKFDDYGRNISIIMIK
tara:strand:- start:5 stop:757 length:753 start_codon:yes stop_codon:yes gene_type:complete